MLCYAMLRHVPLKRSPPNPIDLVHHRLHQGSVPLTHVLRHDPRFPEKWLKIGITDSPDLWQCSGLEVFADGLGAAQ